MATTTIGGHVARALDFFDNNDVYFAIGKSDPWVDEDYPPAPSINDSDVTGVIGLKKIESKHMVVPDEEGDIVYRDSRWRIVPYDQAVVENARWVYISCSLLYDELPLVDYRQVGVYSRVVKNEGILPGKFNLLPSEVADLGILEIIDNRKKTSRNLDQKETLSIVLEF